MKTERFGTRKAAVLVPSTHMMDCLAGVMALRHVVHRVASTEQKLAADRNWNPNLIEIVIVGPLMPAYWKR